MGYGYGYDYGIYITDEYELHDVTGLATDDGDATSYGGIGEWNAPSAPPYQPDDGTAPFIYVCGAVVAVCMVASVVVMGMVYRKTPPKPVRSTINPLIMEDGGPAPRRTVWTDNEF